MILIQSCNHMRPRQFQDFRGFAHDAITPKRSVSGSQVAASGSFAPLLSLNTVLSASKHAASSAAAKTRAVTGDATPLFDAIVEPEGVYSAV